MERREEVHTTVGPLAVRVTGQGHPAVLWHSLFVDDRSWDRLVPRLSGSRRLVLVNGPGHGRSGDPGRRYTMQECAAAARVVVDRLGIAEPVDWVGNAWGGHVGVTAAATWPELCRSLVVFGTPTAALTVVERARTYALLGLYGLTGPSGMVLDGITKVLLSGHTRAHDGEAAQLVHDCVRRADRRKLRNAVVSVSLRRRSLDEALRRLTQPILMVTGGDHHGFTPEQARAAAGMVRHGTAAVVPDTAYLVPFEAPEQSASLIQEFWARQGAINAPEMIDSKGCQWS